MQIDPKCPTQIPPNQIHCIHHPLREFCADEPGRSFVHGRIVNGNAHACAFHQVLSKWTPVLASGRSDHPLSSRNDRRVLIALVPDVTPLRCSIHGSLLHPLRATCLGDPLTSCHPHDHAQALMAFPDRRLVYARPLCEGSLLLLRECPFSPVTEHAAEKGGCTAGLCATIGSIRSSFRPPQEACTDRRQLGP